MGLVQVEMHKNEAGKHVSSDQMNCVFHLPWLCSLYVHLLRFVLGRSALGERVARRNGLTRQV